MDFPNIWRPTAFRNLLVVSAPPFQRNIDSCHPEEPCLLRKKSPLAAANSKRFTAPGTNIIRFTGELFAGGRPARGHRIRRPGNAAQVKLLVQSKRYEPVNRSKTEQRIYYPPLSSAPFAVLECTATNAPNERKIHTL